MNKVVFLGLFCAIAGCSSEPVSNLDQLTISSSNDGELARPLNFNYPLQSRFLAINGQLPIPGAGSTCLASSFRPANSMICFSPDRQTHVVQRYYRFDGGPDDLVQIQQRVKNFQLRLAELTFAAEGGANPSPAEIQQQNDAANQLVNEAREIAIAADKANLFIFRWSSAGSGGGSARLAETAGANSSTESRQSGLVIVGGLRISQLMVGLGDFDTRFGNLPKGTKVATLTLSADNLLYFADANLSSALGVDLDTDLESLLDSSGITPQTKIALRAYAQLSSGQENQGLFLRPVAENRLSVEDAYNKSDNSQVFYSTLTDIGSLARAIGTRDE